LTAKQVNIHEIVDVRDSLGSEANKMENTTILIADDEPAILEALVEYLEELNFNVIAAEDGESALKKFNETSPDVVITGIRMPGMTGDIVCQRIREQSDIPIIVMTGLVEESERLRLLNLGIDDYLMKPFRLTELADKLQISLNSKSGE